VGLKRRIKMKEKINAVDLFTIYKDKLKFFNYITRDRNENPKFRFVKCHLYTPRLSEDGVWKSDAISGDYSYADLENLIIIDSDTIVFPIQDDRVENERDIVCNPMPVPKYACPAEYVSARRSESWIKFKEHVFLTPPEKSEVRTYKE
jgi:hypothetical protein